MTVDRTFALIAVALVSAALFAGDFPHLDEAVEERQIDVLSVAQSLRDRDQLILVDLRDREAFDRFALPGAVRLDDALASRPWPRNAMVVVYGYEGGRLSRQLLQYPSVRFLDHGVAQWLSTILSPAVYRHASASELEAFEEVAQISRYFGGVPRKSDTPITSFDVAASLENLERRGCGF